MVVTSIVNGTLSPVVDHPHDMMFAASISNSHAVVWVVPQ
jgi:hypothetical protein